MYNAMDALMYYTLHVLTFQHDMNVCKLIIPIIPCLCEL